MLEDSLRPLVYISVLNWNSATATIRCLESLARLDYHNYRVLVVDNASADGSIARIQSAFPELEIIRSPENLGYAGGNRLALERAIQDRAELFWILNNDTTVESGTLTALVQAYQRHGLALYGSVTVQPDSRQVVVFGGGWQLDTKGRPRAIGQYNPLYGQLYADCFPDQHERPVGALNGSSLMIPLAVVREHGFMDESFFMNGEEVDYCFRLANEDIKSLIVPRSIVSHEVGGSYRESPQLSQLLKHYYRTRNHFVFIRRYEGWLALAKQICRYLKNTWRFQILALLSPKRAFVRSWPDYLTRLAVEDAILNRLGKRFAPEDYLD